METEENSALLSESAGLEHEAGAIAGAYGSGSIEIYSKEIDLNQCTTNWTIIEGQCTYGYQHC
jgi:hypothetical protein